MGLWACGLVGLWACGPVGLCCCGASALLAPPGCSFLLRLHGAFCLSCFFLALPGYYSQNLASRNLIPGRPKRFFTSPLLRSGKEQPPAERRAPCRVFGVFWASCRVFYFLVVSLLFVCSFGLVVLWACCGPVVGLWWACGGLVVGLWWACGGPVVGLWACGPVGLWACGPVGL